jgi:hypothetical protein
VLKAPTVGENGNPVILIGSGCPIKDFGHDKNEKWQFINRL